ncbi:MAG: DUF1232 domain-containing protein [Chitinophagales bacterium]|nr:DUF1232 domain-containing protein [Chitinophagales bacterium]
MNSIFHKFYDRLIKQAEDLITNNEQVSSLIDQAFEKIGNMSATYYFIQDHIFALVRMLKLWLKQEYKGISTKSVIAVIAALLYFINPLDLIPDFIPFIGQLDDILVLSYLVKTLNHEIQRFMAWEKDRSETA